MILCELLYKLVLFCDIVRVGKNSYCEFDKFELHSEGCVLLNTDYKIEAIAVLLNEDCILTRYYPLISYKDILVENLKKMGCHTKSDCMKLSEESLLDAGLMDIGMVHLFKAFLVLYDIKPAKLREISSVCKKDEDIPSFRELYHLPGVKSTRAMLYCKAGFRSLADIAISSPENIIAKTENVIREENLCLKVPLMKEVKTHIAVARAFSDDLID